MNAIADQVGPTRLQSTPTRRAAVVAAIAIGICSTVLWLWPRGALWLDEAQSVAIAGRSPAGVVNGLRADGAPPLYYALLHGWMWVFGDGAWAVRSMSAVIGVLAVAITSLAARRVAGAAVGWLVVPMMAVHPFIVRYASEARMYTLVMAEVAAGLVLADDVLRTGRRWSWAALAVCSAALMLTHYWSLAVVTAAIVLAVGAHLSCARLGRWSLHRRSPPVHVATAVAAGVVATAPWWPILRFQSVHTGTPWTRPAGPWEALRTVVHWAPGHSWITGAATVVALALLIGGSLAHSADRASAGAGPGLTVRMVSVHLWLAAAFAFAVAHVTHSAFVVRYTSVLFPSTVVLIAVALMRVEVVALRVALLAVMLTGSAVAGIGEAGTLRTRAGSFAGVIAAEANGGDLVLYCPDQLGPAMARLLDGRPLEQAVFPTGSSPERVDWIDYGDRYAAAVPDPFVSSLVGSVRPATVWLVLSTTYPPTQRACAGLFAELVRRYPPARLVIPDDPRWRDHDQLWRFTP